MLWTLAKNMLALAIIFGLSMGFLAFAAGFMSGFTN